MNRPAHAAPVNAPLDASTIAALPKVSLHDHFEGGLRIASVLELADAIGVPAPADSVEELQKWLAAGAESGSLERYLEPFWLTDAVMHRPDHLERLAREFAQDLASDGVIYGEVRWAPETKWSDQMSMREAVEAVQSGFDAVADEQNRAGRPLRVRQILCAMRDASSALDIAHLALECRDLGVVGFDIAGPELGFPPAAHRDAFDLLAGQFMPVTVHAGEADGPASIASALVDGRALRLGHGVRIIDDISPGEPPVLGSVASWVRDRGVVLECSPTSNLQTGAVAGSTVAEHPFNSLYRQGFTVTVNTDNRLMSQTTLTRELSLLVDAFDYGVRDLLQFQLNAAGGTFLPLHERTRLIEQVRSGHLQHPMPEPS